MWIELIERLTSHATLAPPATKAAIQDCEQTLGRPLPGDLVDLLHETNGVGGEYGLGLVWSVELIARENVTFRTAPDYTQFNMPFDPLLFFADAGTATSAPSCCPTGASRPIVLRPCASGISQSSAASREGAHA